jgi:hypothetical protein
MAVMLRLSLTDGCYSLHYAGDDPAVVIALWSCDIDAGRPMPAAILAVVPRVEVGPEGVRVRLNAHRAVSRAAAQAIADRVGLALWDATAGSTC